MVLKRIFLTLFVSALVCLSQAGDLENLFGDLVKLDLENGATVLLLPRGNAPVIHCVVLVDAGAVREIPGKTGVAHYLEHMASRGTKTVSTSNFDKEWKHLHRANEIFDDILAEKHKGNDSEPETIAKLQEKLMQEISAAEKYSETDAYFRILSSVGGRNINAMTSQDMTVYIASIPSNAVELWMILQADRFTDPVFRGFYQEREVILEERRMVYENSPLNSFTGKFLEKAFYVHPYRENIIGRTEDIQNMRYQDLQDFFEEYYGAQNLVFAIVGDIDVPLFKKLAEKHLSSIPSRKKSEPVSIVEPPQTAEKKLVVEKDHGLELLLVGYKAPERGHPDFYVFQAISDILGGNVNSRLRNRLILQERVATHTYCMSEYPGSVYPNLFVILAVPGSSVTHKKCLDIIDEEIALMGKNGVSDEELTGMRKRNKKKFIDSFKDPIQLARQIAHYQIFLGDYSMLLSEYGSINSVNSEDIKRVINTYFIPENRTVGFLKQEGE